MASRKVLSNHKLLLCTCFVCVLLFSSLSGAQGLSEEEIWEVHPSFDVSEQYNDNVRQEAYDDREDDFNVQWRPGLELKYNGEWHHHELEYFSSFRRYHHLAEEDTNTHHLNLVNNLALGKIIVFDVRTSEEFRSERRDPRFAERGNNYQKTNIFSVSPTLRFNLLENTSLVGFYSYSRTSIMEQDKEDYLSNTFGGSIIQRIFDVFEVTGGYRCQQQDFLEDTPDFVDNVFFGGLNWDITSTLRFEGEYGRSIREYDREAETIPDKTTESDVWTVTLRNDINEATYVDISYSQAQEVREITDTEQVLSKTVVANFRQTVEDLFIMSLTGNYQEDDYEFSDRRDLTSDVHLLFSTNFSEIIIFRVGGGYGNNYYWPIAVRENIYSYDAGMTYRPLEWLAGKFDYQHIESDNNLSEDAATEFRTEFTQNIFTFTLSARF